MATIGKLVVTLTAKTAKFKSGLGKAAQVAKKFGKAIFSAGGKVAALGAAAVLAAATGLAVLISKSLDSIDVLGKLASTLDDSTARIAGLRFAANLAGASSATLDKGLKQLTRRIGEAKTGTGEAVDAFKALGLSAVDLAKKMPSQAIIDVAEAINKLPTVAEKVDTAFKLFGRSGVDLINTFAAGREGLEDMIKEAEDFGIAVNNIEAKQIENANDAVTRMKKSFEGLITQLTKKVAPILESIATKLTGLGTAGQSAASVVEIAWLKAIRGLAPVKKFFDDFRAGLLQLQSFKIKREAGKLIFRRIGTTGENREALDAQIATLRAQNAAIQDQITGIQSAETLTELVDRLINNAERRAGQQLKAAEPKPPPGLFETVFNENFLNKVFDRLEAEEAKRQAEFAAARDLFRTEPNAAEQEQLDNAKALLDAFLEVVQLLKNPPPTVLQIGN